MKSAARSCKAVSVAVSFLLLLSVPCPAQAADGSLDSTFGTGGKVTTHFSGTGSSDFATAVAIQTDGRIVAAGVSNIKNGPVDHTPFSLARYNSDGSLDSTFGTGGKVTTSIGRHNELASAVAVQTDGKIVAVGSATITAIDGCDQFGCSDRFVLVRYNSDGTLDTSFGGSGIVITDISGTGQSFDRANAVAIQADGKIVAAGSSSSLGGGDSFAMSRYNSDGSLDTSFGTGGKVLDLTNTPPVAVAIQTDGKIVAVGTIFVSSDDFALARYNSDGSVDTSFGTAGKVTTDFSGAGSIDRANAVLIQTDGKIVAAGVTTANSSRAGFALARYNPDGTLDSSFGTGGKVTTDFVAGGVAQAFGVVQSNGKIVAAGWAQTPTRDFALARYNSNGSLDSTFGTGGKVITDFGAGSSSGSAIALQTDGNIVVAGQTLVVGGGTSFALARYLQASDSIPPTTTIALSPAPNAAGWNNTNVHATVSAVDNPGGSGVAETRCVLDPAGPPASFDAIPAGCVYTGAGADVTSAGVHTFYAASKDVAGNKETPVSASFKIDKTPPLLAITSLAAPADGYLPAQNFSSFPATIGAQPVGLSGTASDSGSGLASVVINGTTNATLGAGTWSASGVTLAVGANSLTVKATDLAGNSTTVSISATLNLDLDGDGIANNVDTNPTVVSTSFSDTKLPNGSPTGKTSGQIVSVSPGVGVKISYSPSPAGINVVVSGSSGRARLTVKGKSGTIRINAPGSGFFSDPAGTITLTMFSGGPAEIDETINGGLVAVIIPQGATALVTETTTNGILTGLNINQTAGTTPVTVNGALLSAGQSFNLTTLSARLALSVKGSVFGLSSILTLPQGTSSSVINPPTQPVSLQIGTFSTTIPPGSFKQNPKGWAFLGTVNGVHLLGLISPLSGGRFQVNIGGLGANLTGTVNPVMVGVTIGNYSGIAAVKAGL
jgi:uncharacterized delta-60 repeat protein